MRLVAIACVLVGCTGVDLTAEAPAFTSSTLSRTGANPFTARFRISGDLPDDSEDVYLTFEVKAPGAASFVFDQNAQIERAKATLEEPVSYDFRVTTVLPACTSSARSSTRAA